MNTLKGIVVVALMIAYGNLYAQTPACVPLTTDVIKSRVTAFNPSFKHELQWTACFGLAGYRLDMFYLDYPLEVLGLQDMTSIENGNQYTVTYDAHDIRLNFQVKGEIAPFCGTGFDMGLGREFFLIDHIRIVATYQADEGGKFTSTAPITIAAENARFNDAMVNAFDALEIPAEDMNNQYFQVTKNIFSNAFRYVNHKPITIQDIGPDAQQVSYGVEYQQQLTSSGGMQPYAYTLLTGELPTGISMDSTGLLLGMSKETGTFNSIVQARDANGCSQSSALAINVTKASQIITFDSIHSYTIGDPAFVLSASSTSGLPVTYIADLNSASKIDVDGNAVSMLSSGRVSITAVQPGNENYLAASPVTQQFCIAPAKPFLSLTGEQSSSTLISSAAIGNQWFLNDIAITEAVDQQLHPSSAGRYSVVVTVDGCQSQPSQAYIYVPTPNKCLGSRVVSFSQGKRKDGKQVPLQRSDAQQAIGTLDANDTETGSIKFVSLGFGGSLVIELDNTLVNVAGNDLRVAETSYGNPSFKDYPEQAEVYASTDGNTWILLGKTNAVSPLSQCSQKLDSDFDLEGKISICKFIKVVDVTNPNARKRNGVNCVEGSTVAFNGASDGFDVDAITCLVNVSPKQASASRSPRPESNVLQREVEVASSGIFPNPATATVTIDFNNEEEFVLPDNGKLEFEVWSSDGTKLGYLSGDIDDDFRTTLALEGLPEGLILMKLVNAGIMRTLKVIKQ